MEAIARINLDTPTGRRIARELERHPKTVKVEYPLPPEIAGQTWYSDDEVWGMVEDIMSEHYGTEIKIR